MELNYPALLIFIGILSVVSSALINWLLLKFSIHLGARNNDDLNQVRWSATTKPSLGGFSLYFVFLFIVSIAGFLKDTNDPTFNKYMIGIIVASTLGFIIGLADDTYNTNPLVKFIGQLTCAFILIGSDIYIRVLGIPAFDYLITIIWVIGLMNSINMLDNMDGITASISCSIIVITFIIAAYSGTNDICTSIVLIGELGALIGFLIFNWNPSKMYMGDTGSQFLGVFLAAISMMFHWGYKDIADAPPFQFKQFVIPMLVFIVPLIDTITVTIRRLMRKQSPFIGGRDHITHHLAYLGLKDRNVAIVLILISLISFPIVVFLIQTLVWKQEYTLFAFAYFILLFLTIQVLYNKGKELNAQKNHTK